MCSEVALSTALSMTKITGKRPNFLINEVVALLVWTANDIRIDISFVAIPQTPILVELLLSKKLLHYKVFKILLAGILDALDFSDLA